MKELSIEEKAKAYDKVVESAKMEKEKSRNLGLLEFIDKYFPELAESEDEKIRKAILWCISTVEHELGCKVIEGFAATELKSWLEKQGERMSDPRYSILDKLIEADGIYQMAMNDAMVQEAKTKAIDALSKLEIGKLLEIEKQGEQKPVWSEEDENIRQWIISDIENLRALQKKSYVIADKEINWLKSFRPQNRWMPSDEQMAELRKYSDNPILRNLYYNLKKLKV